MLTSIIELVSVKCSPSQNLLVFNLPMPSALFWAMNIGHLIRMDFLILINWISPFPILALLMC